MTPGPLHAERTFRPHWRLRTWLRMGVLCGVLLVQSAGPGAVRAWEFSRLWGNPGERWTHQARLPDFSRAGYHGGERDLPAQPPARSVRDFGARGDGVADDTAAFKTALAKGGVIAIPAGRYKLTRRLHFTASGTVLRGAGQETTVLYFSTHLTAAEGALPCTGGTGVPRSCYSFREGFLSAKGSLQELGIEDVTVAFPPTRYGGHFTERGYNGIHFQGVTNSWVRNVTITNFDSALFLYAGTSFCTVQNLTLTGRGGHHGITLLVNAHHNLITGFRVENTSIHDLTVETGATRNVFANGTGVNINFDHHGGRPAENLFSNINIGRGSRPWTSGGVDNTIGPRETFWNIHTATGAALSSAPIFKGKLAPQVNMVGATFTKMTTNEWIEGIAPAQLFPKELYGAQRARRLGNPPDIPPDDPDPPAPAPGLPVYAVTASSAQSPHVATNTTDGNGATRWSAHGAGQWIAYDLGTPMLVREVGIAWYLGHQRQTTFALELSTTGLDWTEVYRGTSRGEGLAAEGTAFPGLLARYVRITGQGNTLNPWNSITEVAIVGLPVVDLSPQAVPEEKP